MPGTKGFLSGILKGFGPCDVSGIVYLLKDILPGKLYN